jgi:hypothetical protein
MALSARIYDALDVLNVSRHKFEGIFDMHGVRTGSPEEVPAFLEKLHNDRYFAMDFWGLVASLEAMGDRISERQLRRTVMDCVCGEWLPNDDPSVAAISKLFDERVKERVEGLPLKPLEEIAARGDATASKPAPHMVEDRIEPVFELAVEQVVEPAVEPAVEPMAELPLMVEAEAPTPEVVEEETPQAEPIPDAVPEMVASDIETLPAWQERPVVELGNLGISSAEHIDQVLSRLEMINLELKLHLDDIDNRVSRLEPHLEELKTQVVRSLGMAATVEASMRAVPPAEPRWAPEEIAAPLAEPRWASEEVAVQPAVPAASETHAEVAAETAPMIGPSEPRVSDDVWPAVDWVGKARNLRGLRTALGVAACLALILWLWGRPRAAVNEATPVATSSPAVVSAPKAPAANEPSASAIKAQVQAEIDATIHKAAAPDDSANVAEEAVAKVPAKAHGTKGDDYIAPPWTKWYTGAPQGGKKVVRPAPTTAKNQTK